MSRPQTDRPGDDRDSPPLLDPLSFALRGSALIEASAGTGKTYTIAALYLRLVLGHGGAGAFPRPLTPPEILVVTFTEAATEELRDRIRHRLAEAARAFLDDAGPTDAVLAGLRADCPRAEWPLQAQQLRLAAEWMDEAAVSTIHGWCNRMLREHAFDSGSLFEQALEADTAQLRQEAVRDYWRSFFYPLSGEDAATVAAWWPTPERLDADLKKLLAQAARLDRATPCEAALRAARTARSAQLAAWRRPYADGWCDALQALLDAAVKAKQVDGRKLQARYYMPWIEQLRAWSRGAAEQPLPSDTAWQRLSPQGLREAWARPEDAPAHAALEDLRTLRDRLAGLPDGRDTVLAHATCWVAARLQKEQHRRAVIGFDDMLVRLHAALHGPAGEGLAQRIRQQFPVALIDEFQDTDPVQYGIFRAIYRPGEASDDRALVLIGDPKQAIYAFRGADIHTYLAARSEAGRLATLGTNFRSTAGMVGAVNRVFLQAEQRPDGAGAFLFRRADGNPVPFLPVAAQGRAQAWVVEDAQPPALTCWWLDARQPLGELAVRERLAAGCAAEVVRLLQLGLAGRAGFREEPHGPIAPVQPADIAILVNKRDEADAVRGALRALGVRSVYLSDQENVFCSPSAAEVQRLLAACAEPEDGRLVRAALGSAVLAQDWAALDRLNHDELHWEAQLERFRGYRACWQRQGVLPMLRRLLHDFAVPQRLIAAGDERQLTDLLHLAELLQQASTMLEGEHALLRHLAEQRAEGGVAADQRQLRLESDAGLLKVVTVHKSKGLEYPLVFVPFASACRPVKDSDLPLQWHEEDGTPRIALRPDAAGQERADRERLGEDVRKLYVALTRARFATWIGVAGTENLGRSALGALLSTSKRPLRAGEVRGVLQERLAGCEAIAVVPAPAPGADRYQPPAPGAVLAPEPPLPARPAEHWWVASYSRLRTEASGQPAGPAAASPEEETWAEAVADRRVASALPLPGTLHALPRGAAAGTFLHGLLEWVGRKGFAAAAADPAGLREQVARRCQAGPWPPHVELLADWLLQWLATPWPLDRLDPLVAAVAPCRLAAIQPELEFWLAARQVDAQALDALVCTHTLDAVPRPRLQPDRLNGMLKGFIDLVFEHQGRYYVADYKSNWLGAGDADYTTEAMRDEVLAQRYELQYSLYLFALHRQLRARLPGYSYARHVGGAVYLFLRGQGAPGGGIHLEKPPEALMDALDALFEAGEAGEEGEEGEEGGA